jgi:hypothetical protein
VRAIDVIAIILVSVFIWFFFLLVGEPYEKEIPAPSYFAEVAAVSHGRVPWQTPVSSFQMGAGPLPNFFGTDFINWLGWMHCLHPARCEIAARMIDIRL